MKKKVISVILTAVLAFSAVGCGGSAANTTARLVCSDLT